MAPRPRKEGLVKLTLSLNERVVLNAKIHALEQRKTLSGLIEELLRAELGKKFLRVAEGETGQYKPSST